MSERIVELSAAELAAKLASGEVSSVDAVTAHLEQIEATDGTPLDAQDRSRGTDGLNAFLHRNREEALDVARGVDEARAKGEQLPELAGVPVAVKDLIVTKGQPTTAASRTPGKRLRASSTSSGKTFSPPVLITWLPRPSRVMAPSASTVAQSPGTDQRWPSKMRKVLADFSSSL